MTLILGTAILNVKYHVSAELLITGIMIHIYSLAKSMYMYTDSVLRTVIIWQASPNLAALMMSVVFSHLSNCMFIDLPEKSLVWLGAADIHQEGDWKWYNPETPMTFTYWSSNGPQPNNGRASNCLTFWKSSAGYKWADEPCNKQYHVICEK
jgi:hypothetical protein